LGGDELADGAEGAGEGGLSGALRFAKVAEQEKAAHDIWRVNDETTRSAVSLAEADTSLSRKLKLAKK